ncbi:hypothetical protein LTR81_024999 [Elasticomyces elasticus]
MNLSDQLPGTPRDVRHFGGNGVHTYRFINAQGKSKFMKWYWLPKLDHRSLVYDEVRKIQGKNNNFQRVDLYNNIEGGIYPEWEFAVQLFPDDGSYIYKGHDFLIPTVIVPFEVNPPMKLGKMILNRNLNNFFAEPESISFAPSNVVDGVSFVPDPLLQWRLMSYDDTATYRHNSPNGYTLPINRPIAPINNNYRDDSISTPNGIGGVREPSANQTLAYTASAGETAGNGPVGRHAAVYDWFGQARLFRGSLDSYAKRYAVDAYRFELGSAGNAAVVQNYTDCTLNKIDKCLARRVAYGVGATLPIIGSGLRTNLNNDTTPYPSLYPLDTSQEANKSNEGLAVAVVANDTVLTAPDLQAMMPLLSTQKVSLTVVAPRIGMLETGVMADTSLLTTSSVFYDALSIGSSLSANSSSRTGLDPDMLDFVMEAYGHGKGIAALGSSGSAVLKVIGIASESGV